MRNGKTETYFEIKPLFLITGLTLGSVFSVQAVVIPNIQQGAIPGIQANGNGSVTVNINSPSASGISHNKFTQFDVSKPGLVLNNNSIKNVDKMTVHSQLTGKEVPVNAHLANGAATLIINEVTSNRPSQLNGKIEVAGKKADVIIANPSGITCNGCGFINVKHGTLTTGTPTVVDGNFKGINVLKGKVTITGQGMDDQSDYTNIIAQSLQVAADLHAKNTLQVRAEGNTRITISDDGLTAEGISSSYTPIVGIDASNLGGMYANKITLFSKSDINNNGIISSASHIDISTAGNLKNTGTIKTGKNGNTTLIAKRINNNQGKVLSDGDAIIYSETDISNDFGKLESKKSLLVNTSSLNNNRGAITANDISITANTVNNTHSQSYMDNGKTSTEGGIHALDDISVIASQQFDNSYGNIISEKGNISLITDNTLTLEHTNINAEKDINLYASTLSDYFGVIDSSLTAGNDINMNIDNLDRFDSETVISAGNDINMNNLSGNNTGMFQNKGTFIANNKINYNHGDFYNYGQFIANNDININANSFSNTASVISMKNININAKNNIINNNGGTLSANKNLSMQGAYTYNHGLLIGRAGVDIDPAKLTNTGNIIGVINKTSY